MYTTCVNNSIHLILAGLKMVLLKVMMEKFHYYDKPEGEDPIGKIMGLTKYGILTGGFFTFYDACMISQCTNAAQFFNTAGYWMLPITGMCVTFSAVTYAATNIRKKDDKINYVLGGIYFPVLIKLSINLSSYNSDLFLTLCSEFSINYFNLFQLT